MTFLGTFKTSPPFTHQIKHRSSLSTVYQFHTWGFCISYVSAGKCGRFLLNCGTKEALKSIEVRLTVAVFRRKKYRKSGRSIKMQMYTSRLGVKGQRTNIIIVLRENEKSIAIPGYAWLSWILKPRLVIWSRLSKRQWTSHKRPGNCRHNTIKNASKLVIDIHTGACF